jgi:hypothetical protein
MLIFILIIDVALVAWSLHLMQEAFDTKEFSFMLAGTLVALCHVGGLFFDGELRWLSNPHGSILDAVLLNRRTFLHDGLRT